ncbi:MAG: hypothetical protein P4M05_02115 [Bradyrhizobium sp.]|nr:hypothetical protein [Bradyrhizobium sp.]
MSRKAPIACLSAHPEVMARIATYRGQRDDQRAAFRLNLISAGYS